MELNSCIETCSLVSNIDTENESDNGNSKNCYEAYNNNTNSESVNNSNCHHHGIRNRKKFIISLNESYQSNCCIKSLIDKNNIEQMLLQQNRDFNEEEESSEEIHNKKINNNKTKMKQTKISKKVTNCINSFLEILLRIIIFIIFIQLERTPAFKRKIQPEELYLYKNPPTADIVPASILLPASFIVPFTVILINYLITHDRYDFSQGNNAITLALGLNGLLTSLLKITVGRPRPDFFYRCFPNGTGYNEEMACLGDLRLVNEGRKSFPSGHSSFAFAGFGFLFLYLSAKLHIFNERGRGKTWRLLLTISPLILALLVAISRTCDYHHHYEDAFVGSIIGMFISFMCYRQYYPSIFNQNNPHKPFLHKTISNNNSSGNSDDSFCEENPLIEDSKNSKWI